MRKRSEVQFYYQTNNYSIHTSSDPTMSLSSTSTATTIIAGAGIQPLRFFSMSNKSLSFYCNNPQALQQFGSAAQINNIICDRAKSDLIYQSLHGCIVIGTPQCGKTSLLFQYAYSVAREGLTTTNAMSSHDNDSNLVVFICSRHKIHSNPPIILQQVQEMSSSSNNNEESGEPGRDEYNNNNNNDGTTTEQQLAEQALKNIKMKYIETDSALRHYLAHVHLMKKLPSMFIIDDFSSFFKPNVARAAIIKTLVLLQNACEYSTRVLQETGGASKCCQFLISDSVAISDQIQQRVQHYDRWVPLVATIQEYRDNILNLSMARVNGRNDKFKMKCLFSMSKSDVHKNNNNNNNEDSAPSHGFTLVHIDYAVSSTPPQTPQAQSQASSSSSPTTTTVAL